jgi:hypothetical protein
VWNAIKGGRGHKATDLAYWLKMQPGTLAWVLKKLTEQGGWRCG